MDTYSDLFDELDSINWEKETAPTAFNYEDGELSYSPDLPNFDEMASIPSPISPIHSPPAAMNETKPAAMDETKPAAMDETKPAAMDETKPAMPSQKEPSSPPAIPSQKEPTPAMDYEPTSPPALRDEKPPANDDDYKPPALNKPPVSCKKEKPSEPPRKFKRPSSSLRPKDLRITLKRKPRPERAPSSTPLKVPSFVKKPKRDVPPPKRDEQPPRQDNKGWKPVQSFKPVEERIFYHSTNHVLALREGEYVLTNGYETASRKTEKHWQQALEQDLRYIAKSTRSVYCVDSLSYNVLARELVKWPNQHPFKLFLNPVKVWETDPDLRPCTFCLSTNCVKWLAIRGGVQRFFRYEIDMLEHKRRQRHIRPQVCI
ncbi:hypothetical protein AVEN_150283-1 [Araneus ventricosus]|uniref:Uncharacterized protein n=1 Tax=Araneus ventricosus TaxID=182803 RepID=A0A4Y2J491_ARAVE|nr:hypothetical protein AVEN_150283-1 [Araneus ventricosus]